MAEKLPNISRAELFQHGKQIGKRALETLLYHTPDIDTIQPADAPEDDIDPETVAQIEAIKKDNPSEGGKINEDRSYRYQLAQTTLSQTLDERYSDDDPQARTTHMQQSLVDGFALTQFFDFKQPDYPLPVGFNDLFLLARSLDESRGVLLRDDNDPYAASWHELYDTTKQMIPVRPAIDEKHLDKVPYDTHALLRAAFDLADENQSDIISEHNKLSRVEYIVQSVMDEIAHSRLAAPHELLAERINDAKARDLPEEIILGFHDELDRRLAARPVIKRSV